MTEDGNSSSTANTPAERPTAHRRDYETRFKAGNQVARRHGLRAGTRTELRRLDRRTSRLFGRYLAYRAEQGRPLQATQLPLGRRYVELEILARDLYALLMSDKPGNATLGRYLSVVRAQGLIAVQLAESVSRHKGGKVDDLRNSALWRIAEESRRERALLEAANGDDE